MTISELKSKLKIIELKSKRTLFMNNLYNILVSLEGEEILTWEDNKVLIALRRHREVKKRLS